MPVRDPRFALGEAIGDSLGQDVQEEAPRLRPLLLELVHEARHDGRVRILELLELAVVGLEAAEAPLQDAVRLLEIRPRSGRGIPHSYLAPRSTATIVALWNCEPFAGGIGAISPTQ